MGCLYPHIVIVVTLICCLGLLSAEACDVGLLLVENRSPAPIVASDYRDAARRRRVTT